MTAVVPSLLFAIPFAGILLSIAIVPLIAPRFWEHRFPILATGWTLAFMVPYTLSFGPISMAQMAWHVLADEYVPFLALVGSLFAVTGGLVVQGKLAGSPLRSTSLLAIGAVLASWIGTTGASMLLIRPLLRGLNTRKHKTHTVVFFIFLVSNIGGALTPIGDPPLFMGYLHGVPFFWTLRHAGPMLAMAIPLLALHFALDHWFWRKELAQGADPVHGPIGFELLGWLNLVWLAGIVVTVVLSGVFAHWGSWVPWTRDLVLVALGFAAYRTTRFDLREANHFSWHPVKEVAILFAAIFLTLAPLIQILGAGRQGPLGALVQAASTPLSAYWITGSLSSLLDNAPTYLVFFHAIGGSLELPRLLHEAHLLEAIGLGSVFFGAMTYIGNAPNLLVHGIAEEGGVRMPGFFGYVLWSSVVLLPLFALVGWIFL